MFLGKAGLGPWRDVFHGLGLAWNGSLWLELRSWVHWLLHSAWAAFGPFRWYKPGVAAVKGQVLCATSAPGNGMVWWELVGCNRPLTQELMVMGT